MKLSCTRDNLHQALSITSHLTAKNVNLPVLQNVLVKAENGSIRFTTTNLEMAISCGVRGKMEEPGECTIPSKLFFDYVSLLPNETTQVEVENDEIHLSCSTNKTKMKGIAASEFPLVPSVEPTRTYQVPADELRRALARTMFAVATNESRPELTGVFMRFAKEDGQKTLTLAATDSYRLAESVISFEGELAGDEDKVIIPSRTLQELARILSVFKDDVESPSHITLGLSDNQAVFTYGTVELVSRTIEGAYPDYTQIIPTDFQTDVTFDRDDFTKAVKSASLFSRTGLFDVTLAFSPGNNSVSLKATDATRGENTAECEAKGDGPDNAVTVNYRYLLDGINAASGEKIRFRMIDASNPCLVEPGVTGDRYRYIVMPIKQ